MDEVKIQINSLPALERLIGGDNKLELELKHSVAKEIIKNHIKGLITDEKITELSNSIKADLEQAKQKLADSMISERHKSGKPTLTTEVKDIIKAAVDKEVKGIIADETAKRLEAMDGKLGQLFNDKELKLTMYITNRIDDIIKVRVKTSLDTILKQMVELSSYYKLEIDQEKAKVERNITLKL